ncbi:hypothetical protein T265_13137 [Opisthorchis viverrini]|uniref:N(6)-L-threonylcarbamoyladenine synthase n=1 Tax=Opisthorchis viverrini TaxID=6198 RepID=A0A075AHW6_OPIVI|nr:hypothetical protein T265_13137 [Opisthorchis viverrini]KER30599.1 hypothetical protein T265_13137 [Opisthorchis viverrini]
MAFMAVIRSADLEDNHCRLNSSAGALFRCLAAVPPEASTRAGILPGRPGLDRGSRVAEVGFEPRTFLSVNSRSNHLGHLAQLTVRLQIGTATSDKLSGCWIPGRSVSDFYLFCNCTWNGVALVSTRDGSIVHEHVASQTRLSVMHVSCLYFDVLCRLGGVLPTVAREFHKTAIEHLTSSALANSGVGWKVNPVIQLHQRRVGHRWYCGHRETWYANVSQSWGYVCKAVGRTLWVGVPFFSITFIFRKPLIPIHHMEAHALTAMLTYPSLTFPYLVLLLSGGHALLALARGLEDFVVLGTALDASPGEVLDKLARRLKLSRLGDSRLSSVSGGRAVELLAAEHKASSPLFEIPLPRSQSRDCDLSFTGIQLNFERLISRLEEELVDVDPRSHSILPVDCLATVCASLQSAVTLLICRCVQRGFEFLRSNGSADFPWPTALVVSGGVAANSVIRAGLSEVAQHFGLPLLAPPARLCTDNGVMIAWNGLLLKRANRRVTWDISSVDFEPKAPFGIDCRALVRNAEIRIEAIKINSVP